MHDEEAQPFKPEGSSSHPAIGNASLDTTPEQHHTLPPHLRKESPQFHLLIHAPEITAGVCKCLLSSYILDYPPPTLVGLQPHTGLSPPQGHKPDNSYMRNQNGIPDVSDYLKKQHNVKDQDAVLLVDGETTLFQLPPSVLLSSYEDASRRENAKLSSLYPEVALPAEERKYSVQRFNQSAFFASSQDDATSGTGSSSLRHHGFKLAMANKYTEDQLNDGVVLGTGSAMRRLFSAANKANNQVIRNDSSTFRTMFAQQRRIRDALFDLTQRASIWIRWQLWLHRQFGIDSAIRAEEEKERSAAAASDVGMGLDIESQMVYSIPETSDENKASRRIGIVMEGAEAAGIEIPYALKHATPPFEMHLAHLHPNTTAPNAASPSSTSGPNPAFPADIAWTDLPLFLSPDSKQLPAILSLPVSSEPSIPSQMTNNEIYESLWFHPYARSLLRQYLLRGSSQEVASEAASGGERWHDSRGGRGGVWTVDGEWIDAADICRGYGGEVFGDGDQWGWVERPAIFPVIPGAAPVPVAASPPPASQEAPVIKVMVVSAAGEVLGEKNSDGDVVSEDGSVLRPADQQQDGAEAQQGQETAQEVKTDQEGGEAAGQETESSSSPIAVMPDGSTKSLADLGVPQPPSSAAAKAVQPGTTGEDGIVFDTSSA